MIIRVFRARARAGAAAAFEAKARQLSVPLMQRQSGLLAYFPGRSLEPEGEEFVMVTVWRDMEALRAFAGDDWRASVIPEEERPLLAASDVAHYTVYAECSLDAPAV